MNIVEIPDPVAQRAQTASAVSHTNDPFNIGAATVGLKPESEHTPKVCSLLLWPCRPVSVVPSAQFQYAFVGYTTSVLSSSGLS